MNKRLALILIIGTFIFPLVLAYFFYNYSTYQAVGKTNHGELFSPTITLTEFKTTVGKKGAKEVSVSYEDIRGKWSLIHLLTSKCDTSCQKAILQSRQLHTALGKRKTRLQRIIVSPPDQYLSTNVPTLHPRVFLLPSPNPFGEAIQKTIPTSLKKSHQVILIDPLGNLVMHFDPASPAKLWLKDIKKLLMASKIG